MARKLSQKALLQQKLDEVTEKLSESRKEKSRRTRAYNKLLKECKAEKGKVIRYLNKSNMLKEELIEAQKESDESLALKKEVKTLKVKVKSLLPFQEKVLALQSQIETLESDLDEALRSLEEVDKLLDGELDLLETNLLKTEPAVQEKIIITEKSPPAEAPTEELFQKTPEEAPPEEVEVKEEESPAPVENDQAGSKDIKIDAEDLDVPDEPVEFHTEESAIENVIETDGAEAESETAEAPENLVADFGSDEEETQPEEAAGSVSGQAEIDALLETAAVDDSDLVDESAETGASDDEMEAMEEALEKSQVLDGLEMQASEQAQSAKSQETASGQDDVDNLLNDISDSMK